MSTLPTTRGLILEHARLIVVEKTSHWAVWMRASVDQRVYEARNLSTCWEQLQVARSSFLAVELTASNYESIIEFLQRVRRWYGDARAAVVGDRHCCKYEWLVREAGAVEAVFSPRRLKPLARIVQRHFRERIAKETNRWPMAPMTSQRSTPR